MKNHFEPLYVACKVKNKYVACGFLTTNDYELVLLIGKYSVSFDRPISQFGLWQITNIVRDLLDRREITTEHEIREVISVCMIDPTDRTVDELVVPDWLIPYYSKYNQEQFPAETRANMTFLLDKFDVQYKGPWPCEGLFCL